MKSVALFAGVMLGMSLRSFIRVMLGVYGMPLGNLGVVSAFFIRSLFMMLGSFVMMPRGLFMMQRGLSVVFCNLGCRSSHCFFPSHIA
jgi:hypothetical protein